MATTLKKDRIADVTEDVTTPETFYNPYIRQQKLYGLKARDKAENNSSRGAGLNKYAKQRCSYTYLTSSTEFKFVAPKCLDKAYEEGDSDCNDIVHGDDRGQCRLGLGTHVGTLKRTPITYFNGEEYEFLDFGKCKDKLWPVRTGIWGEDWFKPEDFDPRFSRFHVYDMVENVETLKSAEGRDSPRFLKLIDPVGTVITMLGMTECGKRVAVHVYGQRPYFYMNKAETDAECGSRDAVTLVNKIVECTSRLSESRNSGYTRYVTSDCFDVDVVVKTDLYYYGTKSVEYYRVRAKSGKYVSAVCDNFCPNVTKYEGSVDTITRLVLDNEKFVTFGWYKLTNGPSGEKVQIRRPENHSTSCDVEINCTAENLVCEPEDQTWPEYKLACFDIECKAGGLNEMAFPSADKEEDVVIQISCITYSVPEKRAEKAMLFSLGSCDLSKECIASLADECGGVAPDVFEFDCEYELLLAFFTFLKQYAPEFVTGYNIINFDWTFMYNKMVDVYGIRLDGYGAFNRGGTFRVWDVGANKFQKKSKAKINGIISLDMYSVATEKLRLRSYKLDSVAQEVLGEHKKDMPYKEIPWKFASGPKGRGAIGEYCIQDSALVGKLFFKYMPHLELSAVAKLAGILLSKAIYDGQQVRVYTCILKLARSRGFILPDNRKRFFGEDSLVLATDDISHVDDDHDEGNSLIIDEDVVHDRGDRNESSAAQKKAPIVKIGPGGASRTVGYQGATVLEPVTGFHVTPVVVFDFASLYPSIIQAHNLCFTTLTLDKSNLEGLEEDKDYFSVMANGKILYFVRPSIRESLLAILLNDWLAMRKRIRTRAAETTDESQAILLDKQQAAIKVVCNSVYGFCGVSNGFLPCLDVAAAVTTIGRDMLIKVRDHVHSQWGNADKLQTAFPKIKTEDFDSNTPYSCSVVYGDTDSVFVKFKGVKASALVRAGGDMATSVSDALFRKPIKLECEKTFEKLLLITKKKYIGTIYGGKMIMKGVELVRRSNCKFINEYSKKLVDLLFNNEEVAAAAAEIGSCPAVDWTCNPLPSGIQPFGMVLIEAYDRIANQSDKLNVDDFVMSAELSRPADAYVNKRIAHLTVYYKMLMRSEQEPAIKERISYVIAEPSEQLERDADAVSRLRGDVPVYSDPDPTNKKGGQGKKRKLLISDLAEDPKYVAEKKAKLSTDYYFTHLIGSLAVTFKALFGNDTKITETILRRFIPETFYEPHDSSDKYVRGGFKALSIDGAHRKSWYTDDSAALVRLEEENHRMLSTALHTLTAARRLC